MGKWSRAEDAGGSDHLRRLWCLRADTLRMLLKPSRVFSRARRQLAAVTASWYIPTLEAPSSVPWIRKRVSRRVMSEDEVAVFGRFVAREAGFVQRLVTRFAVLEVTESPASRRGVLF